VLLVSVVEGFAELFLVIFLAASHFFCLLFSKNKSIIVNGIMKKNNLKNGFAFIKITLTTSTTNLIVFCYIFIFVVL